MKECPNCKKHFTDDLFFCLYDGVPLTESQEDIVDHYAPTEAAINIDQSLRTEVLPNIGRSDPTQLSPVIVQPAPRSPSKLPYIAIALLAFACVTLAAAMVVINRDRIFPERKSQLTNANSSTPTPSPVTSTTPQPSNTAKPTNQATSQLGANISPVGKWKGDWSTDSGTLLDFDLTLTDTGTNGVEGQIKWTMRKTARPDKADKIGQSAIEFVRGTFAPATRTLNMSGYDKDDPKGMLVMLDVYKLNVSSDGHTLTGLARNGTKWNGHIKLTR